MKIQPTQPTFQMKWTQKQMEQTKLTKIVLDNGNRLMIRETPEYKLQTLFDNSNEWIKSKLIYLISGKKIRSNK